MKRWLAATTLYLACVAPARAEFEIGYAHVDEIDGETSQGVVGSWLHPIERWKRADIHIELLGGAIRGRDGQVLEIDRRDNFFVGAGLRKHFGGFFVGAGVAVVARETTLLSSSAQLVTSLGWARSHLTIAFRHISNANTGGNNDGENLLSIGYRW
ncbi:MAG: acyloxyacyl hydrolase [Xanthomonadales bacterium]|nr:hypothetical protein [Xanthomonadales bacterium]MCC6592166.1 acyloxyacyl hydrolase [Xanthomonadales bacterium]MCE7931932.1 hypothetical protein [Xanthomonadales bacterium PRO6]